MSTLYNQTSQKQHTKKLEILRSEINQIQKIKVALSLALLIPMFMLLGGVIGSGFFSSEIILGYSGTLLVVLSYFFLRDLYLSIVHNQVIQHLEDGTSIVHSPNRKKKLAKYVNMPYPIG